MSTSTRTYYTTFKCYSIVFHFHFEEENGNSPPACNHTVVTATDDDTNNKLTSQNLQPKLTTENGTTTAHNG